MATELEGSLQKMQITLEGGLEGRADTWIGTLEEVCMQKEGWEGTHFRQGILKAGATAFRIMRQCSLVLLVSMLGSPLSLPPWDPAEVPHLTNSTTI